MWQKSQRGFCEIQDGFFSCDFLWSVLFMNGGCFFFSLLSVWEKFQLTAWDKDNSATGVGVHIEQCLSSKREINRGWLFRKKRKKEKSSIPNEFNTLPFMFFFFLIPSADRSSCAFPACRHIKNPRPNRPNKRLTRSGKRERKIQSLTNDKEWHWQVFIVKLQI